MTIMSVSPPLQLVRVAAGIICGSVAAALWLVPTSGMSLLFGPGEIHVFVLSTGIMSGLVAICMTVIGIPVYALARRLHFSNVISASAFGFGFGMLASIGFGVNGATRNIVYGVISFGIAGVIAALVFMLAVEGRSAFAKRLGAE